MNIAMTPFNRMFLAIAAYLLVSLPVQAKAEPG